MASADPSPLFTRLVDVWRHLPLRSDIDDFILELIGRFSLEKIYCDASDKKTYQRLVIALLAQLNVVFFVQRLTLPADNIHGSRYLGLFVSWEVAFRAVEFVLQTVTDSRELLWESRVLRDRYLADFLLSALRVLSLHPRGHATHRTRDRRDRFARVHKSLEQLFDSYPGDKSLLLLLCKEITHTLHIDPNALSLPQTLARELPNLTSDLYPLPRCLSPSYINEVVSRHNSSEEWLPQVLALRDIAHFIVGASIEYVSNQETRDTDLKAESMASRNAIFQALDRIRLPLHLSKRDLVAAFAATFRVILQNTPDLSCSEYPELAIDECELDALSTLSVKLSQRQIIHRVSDGEIMHSLSQVVREVLDQDSPTGHYGTPNPGLFVVNCAKCHLFGASQLRASGVKILPSSDRSIVELAPQSSCSACGEGITFAREVPLARKAWEFVGRLEVDADTINVERHLPSQFLSLPPQIDSDGNYGLDLSDTGGQRAYRLPPQRATSRDITASPAPLERTRNISQVLSSTPSLPYIHANDSFRQDRSHPDDITYVSSHEPDTASGDGWAPQRSPTSITGATTPNHMDSPPRRQTEPAIEERKSRWRNPFTSSRRPPAATSGDSSSLSSGTLESQRLEEISLESLLITQKSSSRSKTSKHINTFLSPSSQLSLFWTQFAIQVWNIGNSPPTLLHAIATDSTCILASVSQTYLAYIIGNRDQRLTLRILDLAQLPKPAVDYRMPSSQWCKSIAIDRNENYVVVGFENSVVRFYKTDSADAPREDRLHATQHRDCKGCPSVDTLSFSHDGLALLAGTRSPKTGYIQVYLWRFPFLDFHELASCRYRVPLHESEDNGLTAAHYRSGSEGEENLVCITTWTQSGAPVLAQPRGGHRAVIRTDSKHTKLGSRIQCAAFSSSGRELALVNEKGHLYHVSSLNSSPVDIRKVANSKDFTAKSSSFAMSYMTVADEEVIVLAWADSSRATGWIKKVPVAPSDKASVPGVVYMSNRQFSRDGLTTTAPGPPARPGPAELSAVRDPRELEAPARRS